MTSLEPGDIQGVVARGYGNLRAACFVLLGIEDAVAARNWLGVRIAQVATSKAKAEGSALNLAFTHRGLERLGLPPEAGERFSPEFIEGMCAEHRTRILGDVGESHPDAWAWGSGATAPIDMLLMLYATDEAGLASHSSEVAASLAAGGLREVARLDTTDLGFQEHFGFRDGISQPAIEGLDRPAREMDTVRAGEFLLGHGNEYGQLTDRPTLPRSADPARHLAQAQGDRSRVDFGKNGTYLVFRQLKQEVRGFWRYLAEVTEGADGSPDTAARVRLAAKMVGRWPGGASLSLCPESDDPALATFNDFGYHEGDRDGLGCPIAAHVRRANPRDSLPPGPGTAESISINKRHRLLRRGRTYGPRLSMEDAAVAGPVGAEPEPERGLYFICLGANISRQFEFVQHTWVNSAKFAGLYDDSDPISGQRGPYGNSFTVPANPVRERWTDLPAFVSVRGGGYFFLPSVRALRYLASL